MPRFDMRMLPSLKVRHASVGEQFTLEVFVSEDLYSLTGCLL